MNPLIKMDAIKKIYLSDEVETHALHNIHLHIHEGEYVAIVGPSGCGKSTLLSVIGLLDVASEGSFQLAGHAIGEVSSRDRTYIRNKEIGFIFQSFNLISDMTVMENVELPLSYRHDLNRQQARELAKNALEQVGMQHRLKHFPAQLSGGQQQRVAIARAIAGKPALLLADEPTGNLDSKNADDVMALIDRLHAKGATICMVTHDPRSAARAQRTIKMIDGQIIDDGQSPSSNTLSETDTSSLSR